jgi:pimeloyl-ACP methyl ester carboxylesterase
MAEDVVALMDHLGIAKAHVLGFSMGGFIAQELALAHPDRVDRLILLATAAAPDGYGRNVVAGMVNARRSSMSREQQVRLTASFIYSPALFDDEARFEASIQNSMNNAYAQPDHAFLRQVQACLGFDTRDRLAGLKNPTLVVHGSEDILILPRNGKKLASLLPNATLKELPGGHVGCIEMPVEYNATFLEFLGVGAKQPAAAGA